METGTTRTWMTATLARRVRSVAWWSLVVVSAFNALSALGGGIGMVAADGLSMPKAMLADTPFSTFTIPGLILTLVVGGSQSASVWLLVARHEAALLCSAVAGFGMVIWIVTEIGFIHALMYAQMIYLVTGLVQLILVFALLGIVSWLPRLDRLEPRRAAHMHKGCPPPFVARHVEPQDGITEGSRQGRRDAAGHLGGMEDFTGVSIADRRGDDHHRHGIFS